MRPLKRMDGGLGVEKKIQAFETKMWPSKRMDGGLTVRTALEEALAELVLEPRKVEARPTGQIVQREGLMREPRKVRLVGLMLSGATLLEYELMLRRVGPLADPSA